MRCYVYDRSGKTLERTVDDYDPGCGVDFCDWCGDCLACYAHDPCPRGVHRWVIYEGASVGPEAPDVRRER